MKKECYTQEELKNIQKIEVNILSDVILVCEQLNITYFIVAGTAIGTIRHNGFIPWDDDIDIGMTREDYDLFIKSAPDLLPKKYYLQTPYSRDAVCPYTFSKVRLNGTKFIEYRNRTQKMNQGIYIDVFPFDEVPDDEKENKKQFKNVRFWKNLYYYRTTPDIDVPPENIKSKLKAIFRRVFYYCLFFINPQYIIRKADEYSKLYNGKNQSALSSLDYPKRNIMYIKKDELYPLRLHKFEDIDVYIPFKCEEYLTNQYGDYMKLPPENERVGHKPYIIDVGSY